MQAYLDNSATTRCSERARDIMVKVLMEDYGNPSSLHTMGMVAEGYIRRAKEQIGWNRIQQSGDHWNGTCQ